MYLEDVFIGRGEKLSDLVVAYGHSPADAVAIWNRSENRALREKRGQPENIQYGDVVQVPIPWKFTTVTLSVRKETRELAAGGTLTARRDGGLGARLAFVQVVDRGNQPVGPNPDRLCVDACTPDDDDPFYWTAAELTAQPELRRNFWDPSGRMPPSKAKGTTRWRAIVSIAVETRKRITISNSLLWGWDMTPSGEIRTVGPFEANRDEVKWHLTQLFNGVGRRAGTFARQGWSFRTPPPRIVESPSPVFR